MKQTVTAHVIAHTQADAPGAFPAARALALPCEQPPHLPSPDRAGTQSTHPPVLGLGVPLGHTREPWAVLGSRQVGGQPRTEVWAWGDAALSEGDARRGARDACMPPPAVGRPPAPTSTSSSCVHFRRQPSVLLP